MAEEKKEKRGDHRFLIGLITAVAGVLGLISPSTFMWWWDYIPLFLFGVGGYYVFFPLLLIGGIYLCITHYVRVQFGLARYMLGGLIVILGALSILTHVGFGGGENFSAEGFSLFFANLNEACAEYGSTIPVSIGVGGGIAGYILSSLLSLFHSELAFYFLVVLLILFGLVLLFWKPLLSLIAFLRLKIVKGRARRKGASDEDEISLDEEGAPSESYFSTPNEPVGVLPNYSDADIDSSKDGVSGEIPQIAPQAAPLEEKPLPSRREVREENRQPEPASRNPFPNYGGIPASSYSSHSGLRPAMLDLGGGNKPSEQIMQAPSFEHEEEYEEPASKEPAYQPSFEPAYEEPAKEEENFDEEPETEEAVAPEPIPEPVPEPIIVEPAKPAPAPEPEIIAPAPTPKKEKEEKAQDEVSFGQASQPRARKRPRYELSKGDNLKEYPEDKNAAQNDIDARNRSALIDQALLDLGIGAHVESYTIGPSVTRYYIRNDPNVKVQAIKAVVDDIQQRLGGVLGRFEPVVAGSPCSGLEIPNNKQAIVSFRETFAELPNGPKDNLVVPFGKSIDGKIVFGDLSGFPHMLVAGTTGSGKSIYVHSLVMSLIMRNRPEDLKLILVDPKRVEMGKYNEIPHLLCPPIKEPTEAKVAFEKLCDEMERRYTLFENSGVSDIRQFNADVAPDMHCEKLPFIVCIVDEYADMVDTCKNVSEPVIRLAQKARAAGIHLVICTQRPDVKVIEGRLKANIAVKVALSVGSTMDSMVILGEGGAEKLSGHGDMLVNCSSVQRIGFMRLQGCFVDNKEIREVTNEIRAQQKVVYDPNFLDLKEHGAEPTGEGEYMVPSPAELRAAEGEDKYRMIREAILAREYTSISSIQREFGVGFPRAGKIFARLQKEGIVSTEKDSASSSKGCRVLVHTLPESLVEESEPS